MVGGGVALGPRDLAETKRRAHRALQRRPKWRRSQSRGAELEHWAGLLGAGPDGGGARALGGKLLLFTRED